MGKNPNFAVLGTELRLTPLPSRRQSGTRPASGEGDNDAAVKRKEASELTKRCLDSSGKIQEMLHGLDRYELFLSLFSLLVCIFYVFFLKFQPASVVVRTSVCFSGLSCWSCVRRVRTLEIDDSTSVLLRRSHSTESEIIYGFHHCSALSDSTRPRGMKN